MSQLVPIQTAVPDKMPRIVSIRFSAVFPGGNMRFVCRGVLFAGLLLLVASTANAQSLYGSLVGNVTDETGAALPGANVTVTQTETNLSRDAVTNETGSYNVPNLLPGTYQVAVTLQGFKSYTARDIAVRPDLVLRVD